VRRWLSGFGIDGGKYPVIHLPLLAHARVAAAQAGAFGRVGVNPRNAIPERVWSRFAALKSESVNVLSLRALGPLGDFELDAGLVLEDLKPVPPIAVW
jgi:hypothetical protein